jgi:hypothetical protein
VKKPRRSERRNDLHAPLYDRYARVVRSARGRPALSVIFILVDDMGWGDLSCFGNTEAEPHLAGRRRRNPLFAVLRRSDLFPFALCAR